MLRTVAVNGRGEARNAFRPGELLARRDWVYLLTLLVPLFVYDVGLKVVRVLTRYEAPDDLLGFLDQVRSDLLFNSGYAVLWVGVFVLARSGAPRRVALVLFHASAVLVVAVNTGAHFFYEKTGSTLPWSFLASTLTAFGEVWKVMTSEMEVWHYALVPAVLLFVVVGPTLVTRLFARRLEETPEGPPSPRQAQRAWAALAACLAALFFSVALLPSATDAGNSFSRDPVGNMVVGELSKPKEIQVKLTAGELPTDTRLVSTNGVKRDADKRNVVVVFMESTRARSTTLYREELDTTPFLADLAKESLVARKAYAVVPHTSKALVATLCGVSPPLDTDKTESEPGILPAKCLPTLLKEQGYETAFFQSATDEFERRPQLVENFGYEEFVPVEEMPKKGFEEVNYFGYEDEIMLDPSRQWLEENAQNGPFMATYLTVTPHHNYVVPDRYGEKEYSEDPELDRYMNTVRYQDFFLKKLFEQYREMGLYKDTVFVVLGDHGEGFDEHGLKQHDNTIYNEGLRIPLLVHDPRNPRQKIVEDPTNELDVLPTIADALGYRVRGGSYPGSSMFGPLGERVLRASCYYENVCLARIEGDEKYIYNYGNKGQEFYDLSEDPYERRNIIDGRKEKEISALRRDLLHWQARVEATYEEPPPDKDTAPAQKKAGPPEDAPPKKAPPSRKGPG